MEARVIAFAAIEGLHLQIPAGIGMLMGGRFRLTGDGGDVLARVPSDVTPLIGSLELGSLRRATAVAHLRESWEVSGPDHAIAQLTDLLFVVHLFLQALWLVRDHSARIELGYFLYKHAGAPWMVNRNFYATAFLLADGTQAEVNLSQDDLREAGDQFRVLMGSLEARMNSGSEAPLSRRERAFFFVQSARGFTNLAGRISSYCAGLEALFSSDAAELSHKLAERVAWLVADTPEHRLELFRKVKDAYRVRSKFVHGDSNVGTRESLVVTSVFLDRLLRDLFRRIQGDDRLREIFESTSKAGRESHERFMEELTLGAKLGS